MNPEDICELGNTKFKKHKPRDNQYGVTWCVHCGRLFKKSCGKPLETCSNCLINCGKSVVCSEWKLNNNLKL